jgi:hypothetical protein
MYIYLPVKGSTRARHILWHPERISFPSIRPEVTAGISKLFVEYSCA